MKQITVIIFLSVIALFSSCSRQPQNVKYLDKLPDIYPDYINVSIPPNIAPLNFLLRQKCKSTYATLKFADKTITTSSGSNNICFDFDEWKQITSLSAGNNLELTVYAENENGEYLQFKSFNIYVEKDSIDQYLSYRLIEPDYEVYSKLTIEQRCVENFDKKDICNY